MFESGGFTNAVAEEVKFGAADFAAAQDLDVVDAGGVDEEDSFDSDSLEDAADGDGFGEAAAAFGDDGAFVGLDAFFAAFYDFDCDFYCVSDLDVGEVGFELFRFYGANYFLGFHRCSNSDSLLLYTGWGV